MQLSLKEASTNRWLDAFCRRHDFIDGETNIEATLRIYKEVANKLVFDRDTYGMNATVDMEEGSTEDPHIYKIRTLVLRNVVPVTVYPSFVARLSFPIVADRERLHEQYIREWSYKMRSLYRTGFCRCDGMPTLRTLGEHEHLHSAICVARVPLQALDGHPAYLAGNAFPSGGTSEGVLKALENIRLNTHTVKPPDMRLFAQDLLICMADFILKTRGDSSMKLDPPTFSRASLHRHEFDGTKNAGYFNVRPYVYEDAAGEIFHFVNTCSQDKAYTTTMNSVVVLAKNIRAKISATDKYDRSWFPKLAAKIAVKAEVREPGSDATKTRVFFIMCMIKLLIDKEVFTDAFLACKNKDMCSIGFSWSDGGAHRLALEMNAWDSSWAWFCSDISKLDQRLHAWLLTFIFVSFLTYYAKTNNPENYDVLRAFACFSSDDAAATLVKWLGDSYRVIVGVMFSGLFGTSIGDTVAVILAVKVAIRQFVRKHGYKSGSIPEPKIKIYGDNIFIGWRRDLLDLFVNSSSGFAGGFLGRFLQDVWGMPIKFDETSYHEKFFTEIVTVHDPDTGMRRVNVVYQGPKFLKRAFLEKRFGGLVWAMPFRPSSDYYFKSITTNQTYEHNNLWVARWAGLMLDSMGTNVEAYDFLHFMMGRFLHDYRNDSGDSQDMSSFLANAVKEVPDYWDNRVRKLGLNPGELTTLLLNSSLLRAKFSPDFAPVL